MEKTYKSEDAIQHECYMWFHNTYPELRGCLFAVPNGGARTALQGKIFKMTGVVPGVSDMILLYNKKATLLEFKNVFGTQSPKQIEWQGKMEKQGFEYYIVRNLNTFQKIVKSIVDEL